MTAWQSIFAAGPCTVSVTNNNSGTTPWSGALGLSQSSPVFNSGVAGQNLQVVVDGAGVMSLNSPDDTLTSASGLTLKVTPNFNVSSIPLQAETISAPGGASTNIGGQAGNGVAPPITLTFDTVTGSATPATVSFSAAANASVWVFENLVH